MQKKILLISPRGFCAGVYRALETVDKALEKYGTPLYVNHEIVHNRHIVNNLEKRGVKFGVSPEELEENDTLVFSAHGVSPEVHRQAREKNISVIDATCPLVTKVHREARRYAEQGYQIILIGHKKHAETIGTYGEAPEQMTIVESAEDARALSFSPDTKLAYLTQTTLSILDTREIIDALQEKYPTISAPKSSDICYATTNRQDAVNEVAPQADLLLVLGSRNSSNSSRLRELGERTGTPSYLIDDASELKEEWMENVNVVSITAGASAPESLVQELIEQLQMKYSFEEIQHFVTKDENIKFSLPDSVGVSS